MGIVFHLAPWCLDVSKMQDWNAGWHFCFLMMALKSPEFHPSCSGNIVLCVVQVSCRKLQESVCHYHYCGPLKLSLHCHPW